MTIIFETLKNYRGGEFLERLLIVQDGKFLRLIENYYKYNKCNQFGNI
jgi:hypothetical protein